MSERIAFASPEAQEAFEAVYSAMLTQDAYHLEIAKALRVYMRMNEYICCKPFEKDGGGKCPALEREEKRMPSRPGPDRAPSRMDMGQRVVTLTEITDLCGFDCLKHLPTCQKLGLMVGVKESGLSHLLTIDPQPTLYERYAISRAGDLQAWQFGAPVDGLIP